MNTNTQSQQKESQINTQSLNINTQKIEQKWQHIWKNQKVFQPQPNQKQKFFATVPYPYGNSALHIGHGRTFTTADIFVRYQRTLNKNVLYPMGFHISGTPVLAVADGIANNDAKQIKLTTEAIAEYESNPQTQKELLQKFKDPMEIAKFFSSKIEETFDAIGLSIDWSRQFTTGDKTYQKFIQWQYQKLAEAGILVQGKYPILYSAQDQNAVGEDDIKDGDVDKVAIQEMKYICFELIAHNKPTHEFLVAATLRPDSLFGATNLYIKPDMKLVKLKVADQIWIVAKQAQTKIENQFENVKIISEHTGNEFITEHHHVKVPIIEKIVPIYPMDYPDENHGTGIVYSSPADSPHDYIYLFELKFPNKSLAEFNEDPLHLTPITFTKDKKGNEIKYKSNIPAFDKLHKFKIYNIKGNESKLEEAKEELYKEAHYGAIMINSGEFNNTPLKNNVGANKVKERLETLKLGGTFYETTRRAQTRNGSPVIVANLHGQWFLDYSSDEVKQKATTLLQNMQYLPSHMKQSQQSYLDWVQKRPCARKRGLGTPLPQDPQWIIEPLSDSTIYQMYYIIANYVNQAKLEESDLTYDFFEYIFDNTNTISNVSNEKRTIITQIKKDVAYWKSFDFRYTTPPHMSNHLSFLIYHYALLLKEDLQPKNITVGGLLIKDGEKISKSKGNGIPLIQVPQKYGADLYRLYVATAASFEAEMDFRESEILQLKTKFNKWAELMFAAKNTEKKSYNALTIPQQWLYNRFYKLLREYKTNMDIMKIREAYIKILFEFLSDSAYLERRESKQNVIEVYRHIIEHYALAMAPVTPHVTEEILENIIPKGSYASTTSFRDTNYDIHSQTNEIPNHISNSVELENLIYHAITTIPGICERRQITQPKTITIIIASTQRYKLFNFLKELLLKTRDFKTVIKESATNFPEEKTFIERFVPKTLGSGLQSFAPQEAEKAYLEQAREFLEAEFKATVKIEVAQDDKSSSLPGTPSYIVE
jgi:leucyl-tRNA synthetase